MATLKIYRETALPATLEANAIYFVAPPGSDYVEEYVTGTTGSVVRRAVREADVNAMIQSALASVNEITIVDDIAARDVVDTNTVHQVYVKDATGDASVNSGGATYLYDQTASGWVKISEAESLDVVLNWSALQGKPTSSVADIDDAVAKRHSHANKTQLDKVGENAEGEMTYGGAQVKTTYSSTEW